MKGAFPNAVTEKVVHNLRKRRIPHQYVGVIENMLTNRRTKLCFDDYLSNFTHITAGRTNEDSIGYVNDTIYIVTGPNFELTTKTLHNIMTRWGGGCKWSNSHTS